MFGSRDHLCWTSLIATCALRDVVDPISPHCFIGPEIDADLDRGRHPYELFAKLEVGSDLQQAIEHDLEVTCRVRRTVRCIDRNYGGPFPLHARRLHL